MHTQLVQTLQRARKDPRAGEGRPTREAAFDAFCTLIEFCTNRGADRSTYDQRPGHLPPDAKSADAFKRWHRDARREGLPGVRVRGKVLVATAEAWATPLPRRRKREGKTVPENGDDSALDAALGIRLAKRGG
jgi:hypothetical protein